MKNLLIKFLSHRMDQLKRFHMICSASLTTGIQTRSKLGQNNDDNQDKEENGYKEWDLDGDEDDAV